MESALLMGNELEHLVELITDQYNFNREISTEILYDELIKQIQSYEGRIIISSIRNKVPPGCSIVKTSNFQFFDSGSIVFISNKFFK